MGFGLAQRFHSLHRWLKLAFTGYGMVVIVMAGVSSIKLYSRAWLFGPPAGAGKKGDHTPGG